VPCITVWTPSRWLSRLARVHPSIAHPLVTPGPRASVRHGCTLQPALWEPASFRPSARTGAVLRVVRVTSTQQWWGARAAARPRVGGLETLKGPGPGAPRRLRRRVRTPWAVTVTLRPTRRQQPGPAWPDPGGPFLWTLTQRRGDTVWPCGRPCGRPRATRIAMPTGTLTRGFRCLPPCTDPTSRTSSSWPGSAALRLGPGRSRAPSLRSRFVPVLRLTSTSTYTPATRDSDPRPRPEAPSPSPLEWPRSGPRPAPLPRTAPYGPRGHQPRASRGRALR
jgi:hypothetical protein